MTIRPVDLNGMMQRTQDVSTVKQHEDNQPITQQQSLAVTYEKKLEHQMHHVKKTDDEPNEQEQFDAREEGSNHYQNNRKNKKEKKGDIGQVREKKLTSGFDIKI